MALDKILKVYDDNGNEVDYDILASDVKFLPDGKDLPTKLAELEDEIGQGGYAPPEGGIPKTDLAQSVQDSLDKADSALQDDDVAEVAKTGDYDDLENKPTIPDTSGLATKTELATKQDAIVAGNGIVIGNDGKTVSVDAEVVQPVSADGTFAVRIGGNTYTINLNHSHPQYLQAQSLKAGSNVSISVNQQTGEVTINAAGGSGGGGISGITMNGATLPVGSNGVVDLGTVITSLAGYVLSSALAAVATSGSYNDLSNKPDLSGLVNIGKIINAKDNTTKRLWIGTQAEYDSLTTFESDVLYLIKATKNIAGITITAGTPSQNSVQLTATISPAGADDVTLAWSISENGTNYSNDTTHFSINSSGLLTIKEGADNASVTVKCEDVNEASGTASATLQLTGLSYQDLTYIQFEDMATKRMVMNAIGGNKTIPSSVTDAQLLADQNLGMSSQYYLTKSEAAAVTSLVLENNNTAKKFKEFKWFTAMRECNSAAGTGRFYFSELSLEEIEFPATLTGWSSPLYNLRSLKKIDLRGTAITSHSGSLFKVSGTNAYALDSIYLPNDLEEVGPIVEHENTSIDVSPRYIVFGTGFTGTKSNDTFNLVSRRNTTNKGLNFVFTSQNVPTQFATAFVAGTNPLYKLQLYYPDSAASDYSNFFSGITDKRSYVSTCTVGYYEGSTKTEDLTSATFAEEYSCVVPGLNLNGKTGQDRIQMAGISGTIVDIGIFTYDTQTGTLVIPFVSGDIRIINN